MGFRIHTQRQVSTICVASVFAFLPTLVVALRVWARRIQRVRLAPSEYCMFGALVCDWGICACAIVAVVYGGVGLHEKEVPFSAIEVFEKSLYSIELLWAAAEGLVKTSMCLLYIQIFQTRGFKIAAYTMIGISNAFAVAVILATTFICSPIDISFDPDIPGRCGNEESLWLSIGILNIITDACVVVLPMPKLWQLQIPMKRRAALIGIFSLGLFVCVVSCIRLKYLMDVQFKGDTTYTVSNAITWSLLEPTLSVTIGCLPSTAPLFAKYFMRWTKLRSPTGSSDPSARHNNTEKRSRGTDDSQVTVDPYESGIRVVTEWEVERQRTQQTM